MQLLFVVNPAASSVTPRIQVMIQRVFSEHHDLRVAETTRRNHATRLAEDAARRGVDAVVVLGGDGTLNEVANGIAGTATALVPLPGGSTNVFCRSLGLPDDPHDAAQRSVALLDRGSISTIGLGSANGRYFLFHAGVGFDAAVVEQVERQSDLKRYLNHPLFVWAAVQTWMRHYDRSSPAFTVEIPGRAPIDAYFAVGLNTDPYTYLGSMPLRLAPAAALDQPLSIAALTSLRSDRLLRLARAALRNRSGLEGHGATVVDGVTTATIRGHRPVPLQIDGDYVDTTTTIEFGHHPDLLRLAHAGAATTQH